MRNVVFALLSIIRTWISGRSLMYRESMLKRMIVGVSRFVREIIAMSFVIEALCLRGNG